MHGNNQSVEIFDKPFGKVCADLIELLLERFSRFALFVQLRLVRTSTEGKERSDVLLSQIRLAFYLEA